ncbi:MAG: CopG family transcriptional regulator [Proteobacteria bacterium]|nr:MAG: CopG family transcriptional regulator [Pseudomonadota bacterium]
MYIHYVRLAMPKHTLLEAVSNPNPRVMFSARLTNEVLDKLAALSKKTERSRADIIERLISKAYEEIVGKKKPPPRP